MGAYTVYMHVNKTNKKKYIGITSKAVDVRWKKGEGYKCSTYFYNAIKKYGWNEFEHIIIMSELSEEDAKNMEIQLIKKYNATNSSNGYNLTHGGQGNVPNELVRRKMSESQKIAQNDPIHKAKMWEIRKATWQSPEFKKRLSAIMKTRWNDVEIKNKIIEKLKQNGANPDFKRKMSEITLGENNGFYGKLHTEETKQKMRLKKIGTKQTEEHKEKVSNALKKKVVKLTRDGEYIAVYNGISHIDEGFATSHISACCKGKRKTSGGFKWMYYEDYLKQPAI